MSGERWDQPGTFTPDATVRAVGLSVDYGRCHALSDVTLALPAGEIFGLLGANGAGKTTLFRVLATLQAPTRGRVWVRGCELPGQRCGARAALAYMPDTAPAPSDLRAEEYLLYFAGCHGLRGAAAAARVTECLEAVDLRREARVICTRLSLGQRQRLAVARAVLHRPRVLLLDEPANGLDATARVELRSVLRCQAAAGATVVLSSHVAAEVQELCTSVGLLRRGELLDAGPLPAVLARHAGGARRMVATAPAGAAAAAEWLRKVPGVRLDAGDTACAGPTVTFFLEAAAPTAEELFAALGAARLGVTELRGSPPSIEDVVLHLSRS